MRTAILGAITLSTLLLAGRANAQTLGETPPATAAGPGMGGVGQVVIEGDFKVDFLYNADAEASSLELSPAVDYFIAPNLSVGGQFVFQHQSVPTITGGTTSQTVFGLAPRVGFFVPLQPMFSVYPRAGLSFLRNTMGSGYNLLSLNAYAPFLFHPVPHFFIGLGPVLSWDIAGGSVGGGNIRTVNFGLLSTVGGWFDW